MIKRENKRLKTALAVLSGRKKPILSNPQELGRLLRDLGLEEQKVYDAIRSASTPDPFLEMSEDIVYDYLTNSLINVFSE